MTSSQIGFDLTRLRAHQIILRTFPPFCYPDTR